MPDRVVLVGHPGHKRVELFQQALARLGHPPAEVVTYRDLLSGADALERVVRPGTLVRLESPGQDFEVEKVLLALGAAVPETDYPGATWLDTAQAPHLPSERGRIRYPRQWYRGFRALLQRLDRDLSACPTARWMNTPSDIALMFDKPACHRLFTAADIAVPFSLGKVGCCDELLTRMRETRRQRVFVKLASGSSASGTVALASNGRQLRATTTVELVRDAGDWRLYNSRRVRTYESLGEIVPLLDALCREGVQVEEWVPKAGTAGSVFDLRVVVIAGQARHTVVRLSHTPMTNLHLLNRRGDVQALRGEMGEDRWQAALHACERAAALFPESWYSGVDLLCTPGFRQQRVLEINAFGDLLPGVLWQGMDTYATELQSLTILSRDGSPCLTPTASSAAATFCC